MRCCHQFTTFWTRKAWYWRNREQKISKKKCPPGVPLDTKCSLISMEIKVCQKWAILGRTRFWSFCVCFRADVAFVESKQEGWQLCATNKWDARNPSDKGCESSHLLNNSISTYLTALSHNFPNTPATKICKNLKNKTRQTSKTSQISEKLEFWGNVPVSVTHMALIVQIQKQPVTQSQASGTIFSLVTPTAHEHS